MGDSLLVFRRLLWRARKPRSVEQAKTPTLLSSSVVLKLWQDDGGDREAALVAARRQVRGLRQEVQDDQRWARLRRLVDTAGDPWNAADWPDGFDPLLCCLPLCRLVAYECARCHVGERQGAMSCAHPRSLFGRIGKLIEAADRPVLLAHLSAIEAVLSGDAEWSPEHERLLPPSTRDAP